MPIIIRLLLIAVIGFTAGHAAAEERRYDIHMHLETTSSVKGVAFSPDGRWVAAGTEPDHPWIYIWNRETGEVVHTIKDHEFAVWTVSFSSDSTRLVSASLDESVIVWDVQTGKKQTTIDPQNVGAFRAMFTPDGASVLVIGQQNNIGSYDAQTGKQERLYLPQVGESLYALDVSADGALVLGGGRWNAVSAFERATSQLLYAHRAHGGIVRAIAVSPDNRFYLSGGDDKAIRMWEFGKLTPVKTFSGHDRWTMTLAIRADGKRFVSGGYGGVTALWDVESGKIIGRLHNPDGEYGEVAFSPDGRMVAVGTGTGVNLYRLDDDKSVHDGGGSVDSHETVASEAAVGSADDVDPRPEERQANAKPQLAVGGGEGDNLGEKHALVIGLSKYSVDPLDNPENDAKDMATTLARIGFKVEVRLNTDLAAMRLALAEFEASLPENAVALVYYAGHAVQLEGNSYLLPIGSIAEIESSADLRRLGLSLSELVSPFARRMDAISIFILDACRNSPFATIPEITAGLSRGTPVRGMTDITLGSGDGRPNERMGISGSLIAYSTSPDTVAEDGTGRNSPYTKHLKQHLLKPNTSIEEVLKATRLGVTKETKGRQTPWYESSISGDFYPAGRNRIEFADLLRLLVPVDDGMERSEQGSYGYDWAMASGSNSPIEWLHDGVGASDKEGRNNYWGSEDWNHGFQRSGEVVIIRDGEPTHYGLGKKKEPGKWKITMLGPRAGASVVKITSETYADRLPITDILQEEMACRRHANSLGGYHVYRVRLPGHVFAWLGETFSCGTAGCNAEYALVYSRRDAKELGCP